MNKRNRFVFPALLLCASLAGCTANSDAQNTDTALAAETTTSDATTQAAEEADSGMTDAANTQTAVSADSSETVSETVEDNTDLNISAGGTYVLSGSAKNATVIVDASDSDRVALVLDGVKITNEDFPCIYVKNADEVLVSAPAGTQNELSVTGSFRADGTTNTDAVIFSRDTLELSGDGAIQIASSGNGISCKDDLVISGTVLNVTCTADALEANDSILVSDGDITITTQKDGLHAEYDEDDTLGQIEITGGTLRVTATDDAIHATTTAVIRGGTMNLEAAEGIEATVIEIGGGTIEIAASDDGINASQKSTFATPSFTMNDGNLKITMGAGDTDAIDSNGNLYINGGTIDITAQSPFDYTGAGELNGGTVTVNGTEVTSLGNQMMGGGMGGFRGGMGGGRFSNGTTQPADGSMPDGTTPPADGTMPENGTFRGGRGGRGGMGGGRGGFPGNAPGQGNTAGESNTAGEGGST